MHFCDGACENHYCKISDVAHLEHIKSGYLNDVLIFVYIPHVHPCEDRCECRCGSNALYAFIGYYLHTEN